MSLVEKLLKNTTVKTTSVLSESEFFGKQEFVQTRIPMINVALSGRIDGGLQSGLLVIAGKSKHFKSMFALLMAAAFLKKYPDAIMLFYVSEFGTPDAYFKALGIDKDRVIMTPVTDIEILKQDVMNQLDNLEKRDRVVIVLDSLGNLASKKEVDDALDQKSVADMTRAKAIKSLFRMVTPHLTLKAIPFIAVNHIYQSQSGNVPVDIVSGGTGPYLSADNIWIVGRRQDKDGTELEGYYFIINIEKSRYVKEKSKIPISVTWEGGINKWSGLVDLALEANIITKPKPGWYHFNGKNMRLSEIETDDEFWKDIFKTTDLQDFIEKKFLIVPGDAQEIITGDGLVI